MVEDAGPQLVFGPGRDRTIRLREVAEAREGLVAVAARVEEVDGLAARDAVAGRCDVDAGPGLGHHVGRLQHVMPRIEEVGDVVQTAACAADEGDVARFTWQAMLAQYEKDNSHEQG